MWTRSAVLRSTANSGAVDRGDRLRAAQRGREERLARLRERGEVDGFLDGAAVLEHQRPRYPCEATGRKRRRHQLAVAHRKDVGARAFTDLAARIEEQRIGG